MKDQSLKKRVQFFLEILAAFACYTIILLVVRNAIPDAPQIIQQIETVYGNYGYDLVFWGALLEGTFIVGFYIPGSFMVLLGAALAREGVISFPLVILFGTLGLTLGYAINYGLGRFGWYRILARFGFGSKLSNAKKSLQEYEQEAVFFGYMMPSTASFLSTAAGTLRLPFDQFMLQSFVVQGYWSSLWGLLAFTFGLSFIEAFLQYFGFIALAGFVAFLFKKHRARKKRERVANSR